MRTETKTFTIVAGFLVSFAASYAIWHQVARGTVDWPGVIMLGGSGTLLAMIGLYTAVIARRIEPRPEDRPDAEISEGAGEVGFFSPGSYWPFGLAAAAATAGLGLALWQLWLIVAGAVAVLLTTGGLLFEYYTGARRAESLPPATPAVAVSGAGRDEPAGTDGGVSGHRPRVAVDGSIAARTGGGLPVGADRHR